MDRLIYGLVLVAVTVIRRLPLKVCFALGMGIGFLLWLVLPGYRRLGCENLRIAFGKTKSEKELGKLNYRHFLNLGANLLCALKVSALSEKEIEECCEMVNFDELRRVVAKGSGAIAAISHYGNWELFAQLVFHIRPTPCGTVYQAIHNREIDELINSSRRRLGVQTFDRKRGFTGAIQLLRDGGLLGVLIDQHAGNSGIWTPLFGKLASTAPLAATLAERTGAGIVPISIQTVGFAKWKTVVADEIPTAGKRIEQVTYELNLALESQIRQSPADWFWVHNRWKTPLPEFLLANVKRGLFLPPDVPLQPFRMLLRSSNWLGDAVMSIPAARAMKLGRPDAKVTVLSPKKIADLWRAVPQVDNVIEIEAGESPFSVARRIKGKFDAAILFPNSLRSALEVWLAKIPRRTGYRGHRRAKLLNQIERDPKRGLRPAHQANQFSNLARKLGAPTLPQPFPESLWKPVTPTRIGLCPGAEFGPAKRWLPERFRGVMDAVSTRRDCEWTLVGVAKDLPLGEEILQGFSHPHQNLIGKTSLAGLIEELRTFRVLLTNDTGTMHLAAFLGVPTVALFGSTEPALTAPLGDNHHIIRHQVECSPCFLRECPIDFRCMKAITVDEVVEAVLRAIEE